MNEGVGRSASFSLTVEDYISANRLNMIRIYRKPRTWLRVVLGVALALVVASILRHTLPRNITYLVLMVIAFLILRLMFQYFVALPAGCRKRFFENRSLRQPTAVNWSTEQLEILRNGKHGRLAWKDMADMIENDDVLLFYPSPRFMHIVPKRSLSEAQMVDLLNCASDGIDL